MTTVTSNITGDNYDLADLAKENGTIQHNGKTLYLLSQAVVDNYGTEGLVRYYADAIDIDGIEYRVVWTITDDWDLACEYARLNSESDKDDEQIARCDELAEMALPDVNDESNACDWSIPASVQVA